MATEIAAHQADPILTARSLRRRAHSPVTTMEEAQTLLAQCETLRRPVKADWLMGRVATLLSHFYVSSTEEAEMRAVLTDWARALSEFPQWAIEEACQEYLQTQERKPTIAAIRKLCQQHFSVVEYTRQKAMRGPVNEDRREFSDEHRADMTRRMAEAGNKTLAEMQARMGGKA